MEKIKLFCVSLGCDKNLVDTEKMLGLLNREGYAFTDDEGEADAILINTCCFIGDAKEESVNTILEMARLKEEGRCRALVVAGCLAQRYKEEILEEIPEVDGILGTTSCDEIVNVLNGILGREKPAPVSCFHDLAEPPTGGENRVVTTGGYYAHLKIAEGCDKRCTYCIIPYLRGSFRSVPMEQLVREAGQLAEQGVKELILVAQETTLYGKDLYGEKALPKLLHELAKVPGIQWIRLQYCYPEEITDELIEAIRTEEKVCHYLDIPIQHASDGILRRMGRRTNQAQLREMIARLRREIPDIALRTTLISGFPGETQGITRSSWPLWMRWNLSGWAFSPTRRRRTRRLTRSRTRFLRRSRRSAGTRSWNFSRRFPLKRQKRWWARACGAWWKEKSLMSMHTWQEPTRMHPAWMAICSFRPSKNSCPVIL